MRELLILICVLTISCSSNKLLFLEIYDHAAATQEPGKCYYSIRNNEAEEWDFRSHVLIEIEDATYRKRIKSYKVSELLADQPNRSTVSILTRNAHVSYQFAVDKLKELRYKGDIGYAYCIIENAPYYKSYHKDSLLNDYIDVEIIEITKPSQIKYYEISGQPKMIMENQLYLPAGQWSVERELVYGSSCPPDIYRRVKKALIAKGFDLDETNSVDYKVKEAMQQFQRQNNLPVGQLNFETLKLLGITD